ncbi:unnamed protein product [Pleuronectes platessa]|uniref:Uncharacterized protein n=1 Tax=Pleuronectes platessa TaxID=8262 RepID=A0A9N7UUS6_PLEPL|nr:unnamed protein product [Pleuronectes platessa]
MDSQGEKRLLVRSWNEAQQQQVRRETSEEDSTNDERVEADMVDHLTCESLRSCSPSVHVRGLALCLPPLSAFTVDHLTCESLRSCYPDKGRAGRGVPLGLPFWAGLQLQI